MAEKWQVAVYRIHSSSETTKNVYQKLQERGITYEQKQQVLLRNLLKVEGGNGYRTQKLLEKELQNFEIFLFYRKYPKAPAPWKQFLKSKVHEGATIHIESRNMNESFIMFLYHSLDKQLYVITGGYGAFTILNFTQYDFGIEILTKIVKDKGERVLKSAYEFGVIGAIIGSAKHFRKEFNFYENQNFGNIYREISASIDKNILIELGLSVNETKQCIAKSSFKLKQSITFDEMINIVAKLNNIIKKEANFSINEIKKLDTKKDENLITKLTKLLKDEIWNYRNDIETLKEKLDFVHKDIEKFLSAKKFKCCRNEYEDILTLFEFVMEIVSSSGKRNFEQKIVNSYIKSLDNEDNELTTDTILNHLVYELEYEGKSYFYINGLYYEIVNTFINNLNESCSEFINNNYINGLDKIWEDGKREGEYNLLYKGDDSTIILDTMTPENIEPCDVLKYNEEYVYLYHVKKGFNGSMRDLTNQVYIAANRIVEDLKSGKNYLKQVYEKMESSDIYKGQIESEEKFLSIFEDKKLCFVIAIKDNGEDRDLKQVEQFKSNIAKFALKELINNMKALGVEFRITQVYKS